MSKDPDRLKLVDQSFKELDLKIIEKIDNLPKFMAEHPECSFLAHMAVFRMQSQSTKCRIVGLSNLCEKNAEKPMTLSHNQAMHAGPSLNAKLSTALINLRFGSHLLIFDIKKAFNNIGLTDVDANRLLFLWYRNVAKNDLELVAYRNIKLSFGLRCSPTLLTLALYRMLILDAENDPIELKELKKQIFQLSYVDNCSVATDDIKKLQWSFKQLNEIFNPYCFYLQQFVTNDAILQAQIDSSLSDEDKTPDQVKLLGLQWNHVNDTISTNPISLSIQANTKRQWRAVRGTRVSRVSLKFQVPASKHVCNIILAAVNQ